MQQAVAYPVSSSLMELSVLPWNLSSQFGSTCWSFLAIVGAVYLLKITFELLSTLWRGFHAYFLTHFGICCVDVRTLGSWAVVTGASEGIGKSYAVELARRGLNIVLMSRSREKLQKVADEIQEKYGREVLVVPVDFTHGKNVYTSLAEKLETLDIGVLVNNVGLSHKYAQFLLEAGAQRLRDMIEVNCQALVKMTHLVLPAMVARKRGAIINLSSFSSLQPLPLIGVYSATKIFVTYFSKALQKEYEYSGVIVQNVMPFFISTAMTKMHPSFFVPSPADYVQAAVATIGVQSSTFGCFSHALLGFVHRLTPTCVTRQVFWNTLMYARNRYLKIMEKRKMED